MKKKKKEKKRIFLNIWIESEQLLKLVQKLFEKRSSYGFLKTLDDENTVITLNYGKETYYRNRENYVFNLESNKPIGSWKPSIQEITIFKAIQ